MTDRCNGPNPTTLRVELGQALFALSDALDLVGIEDIHHGKRVAWLTQQLLSMAGLAGLIHDARQAALLHDLGVASSRHHQSLLVGLGANDTHCETGARLLRHFEPLAHLAEVVRHHHTPWHQLEGLEANTALMANAVFLADRIDVINARLRPDTSAALGPIVRAGLFDRYPHTFHPSLIDAARGLLDQRDLVETLSKGEAVLAPGDEGTPRFLSQPEVRQLANLFAQAVDAKSTFTASHSRGVAALARHLGEAIGLDGDNLHTLEISALLHDLGKLRVPDEVLDKPAALTAAERAMMMKHPVDSREILARVRGFDRIARCAGMHHEFLDGSGYPDGLEGDQISIGARIITVADIFQALAQSRPYRAALPPNEILTILNTHASQGHVDASFVKILCDDSERSLRLALIEESR